MNGGYLVFRSARYYPCGARDDFQARVDDADAWIAAHPLQSSDEWYDVLDVETNGWRTIEYVEPCRPITTSKSRTFRAVPLTRVGPK
jgi:hypothetical protein